MMKSQAKRLFARSVHLPHNEQIETPRNPFVVSNDYNAKIYKWYAQKLDDYEPISF